MKETPWQTAVLPQGETPEGSGWEPIAVTTAEEEERIEDSQRYETVTVFYVLWRRRGGA